MRLLRGLGALGALLLGLIGVPAGLVILGGNPVPANLSWPAIQSALLQPDDGTILIGLITIAGWLAWLVFAISVIAEVIEWGSGYRIHIRVPGLAGPKRLVAGLFIWVVAMSAGPEQGHAESPAPLAAPEEPALESLISTARPAVTPVAAGKVHLVEPGDDLWSLAQHYYGSGREWRKIAMANPDLLSGGPDRLRPGWRLNVPEVNRPDIVTSDRTLLVKPGDTLSSIAGEMYGNESDWPRIYRANHAQLNDPDELVPGMRLVLPGSKPAIKRAVQKPEQPAARDNADRRGATPETVEPTPQSAPPPLSQQPKQDSHDHATVALGLASVGSLLAAGVIAGLRFRRRVQLQLRPIGRRIASAPEPSRQAEVILSQRQRPLSLRTLDLGTRAVSAHCYRTGSPVPSLRLAMVAEEQIELAFASAVPDPPPGFRVSGSSWVLDRDDRDRLLEIAGIDRALRPYPSLVCIGRDDQSRQFLVDLEGVGILALDGEPSTSASVLAAIGLELVFSPSADEMVLTIVGDCGGLPEALNKHNVTQTDDLDGLLDRVERRAAIQRAEQSGTPAGRFRIDPDMADAWAPEVILINEAMTAEQSRRLITLITTAPPVTMAAVVAVPLLDAPWSLRLHEVAESGDVRATLEPLDLQLRAQSIQQPAQQAVVDLVAVTGSEETTPAPWWHHGSQPPDPPPDKVSYLGSTFGGWNNSGGDGEEMAQTRIAQPGENGSHPLLQLLGPIELAGAAGRAPPRAAKQCLEYCAWLLENPGTTAMAMASALAVAEGTRRSNMSRLRTWLGADSSGEPYLPDAYTGRITLHPAVSSDWQRFQILTSPAINRCGTSALRAALELVRGAPLADAAPGQWHWAEELRTDMISAIRDLGVELTSRALEDHDLDLARWAASRALAAAPGDELLMTARIRTEHQAGNAAETGRLTLQVAAQARTLGLDLDPETVNLLQEVMEGQVRARMAQ